MAILDHEAWLDVDGVAQGGTETIVDGAFTTEVTATFTGLVDDSDAQGTGDDLTVNFTDSPVISNFAFSTAVENLTFNLNGLNEAEDLFDDFWFIEALDENGDPVPAADILASINANNSAAVLSNFTITMVGNQVRIDADTDTPTDLVIVMPGAISNLTLTADRGPDATDPDGVSGGSGISDFVFDVECFVRGSLILTEAGEIAVEDLRVGDKVSTLDNGFQEIRWVGSRTVKAVGEVAPILIKKDTLGNSKDLYVSPWHRMLISGWRAELLFGETEVLVAAKHLINDDTIHAKEGGEVEYFHILFDRHEIIYANGSPSESFHPNDVSLGGLASETRAEILDLFPELENGKDSFGPFVRPTLDAHEIALISL